MFLLFLFGFEWWWWRKERFAFFHAIQIFVLAVTTAILRRPILLHLFPTNAALQRHRWEMNAAHLSLLFLCTIKNIFQLYFKFFKKNPHILNTDLWTVVSSLVLFWPVRMIIIMKIVYSTFVVNHNGNSTQAFKHGNSVCITWIQHWHMCAFLLNIWNIRLLCTHDGVLFTA